MDAGSILNSKPPRYWFWCTALAILALVWVALVALLLGSSSKLTDQAFSTNQRVAIDLAAVPPPVLPSPVKAVVPPPAPPVVVVTPPPASPISPVPIPNPSVTPAEPKLMPAARIDPRANPEVTETDLAPPVAPATEPASPPSPPVTSSPPVPPVPEAPSAPPQAAAPPAPAEPPATPDSIAQAPPSVEAAPITAEDALPQIDPKLSETTKGGPGLPVAVGGVKPSDYYARPFAAKKNMPIIAIALSGLGYSKSVTETALNLPGVVSLIFSPYARDTNIWVPGARGRGHEIWVELPMEPTDFPASDPGPHAIMSQISAAENLTRLQWVMSQFPGFAGLYSPPDENVTMNSEVMKTVVDELNKRGLVLMMGNTSANPVRKELLAKNTDTVFTPDIVLEDDVSGAAMLKQLADAETLAKKQGHVLIVGRAYPAVMKIIDGWYRSLPEHGIQLAPASALRGMK